MSATIQLVTAPLSSARTACLSERLREQVRADPGSAWWLGPTPAALEQVRVRLLQGGGLCGFRLLTFPDLVDLLLTRGGVVPGMLTPGQRRLLLEEVVGELADHGQLPRFARVAATRGFLEALLGLIDELQQAGVTPRSLARAAYARPLDNGEAIRRCGGRSIRLQDRECARLYARYTRALRRRSVRDESGSARQAVALLRSGQAALPDEVRVLLVDGFVEFTSDQWALLGALSSRLAELHVSLSEEPGDERAELFSRPRETAEKLAGLGTVARARLPGPILDVGGDERPAGLLHLARQLFRPLRRVECSDRADGLFLLEAPGLLGEARLVARRVKETLLADTPPEEILVVARDLAAYADLLQEVFAEYGLPVDIEGNTTLIRNPAVSLILRALRLPEDNWPFAGVTALLRHTYFRPAWPEAAGAPDLPNRAEALLRLLGEPRGRDAYLAAVDRWAEQQQQGLEDEQAEESRRRRTHELAQLCRPFLHRFFRAWDAAPLRAPSSMYLAWLGRFVEDLGIGPVARDNDPDRLALDAFQGELVRWSEGLPPGVVLDRKTFLRRASEVASGTDLPRPPGGPGRVRVRSAPEARHLDCSFLFLIGLSERAFPRAGGPPSLFDDADRQAFLQAGLDLPRARDPLPDEMLLFHDLLTRARRSVVFSYPALDERGQDLLPCSFLQAVLDCFSPGTIPTLRRRMLLEGYNSDPPLSPAEFRVRCAAAWHDTPGGAWGDGLEPDLRDNLRVAAGLYQHRFLTREHNPWDGLFRDPRLIESVRQQFGPERVFSPTALEEYVACPFKFFLRHVLYLEPLEEPQEEIAVTRRGMAFHRGLARLHRRLQEEGVHHPAEEVHERVLREIAGAVEEDVQRAASPATRELWRLEGLRLLKHAARYRGHWQKFLKPWLERGIQPRPHLFEVDFGLPVPDGQQPQPPLVLRSDDIEVRISGRIDRVDLAELEDGVGFWIIDYKTGRSSHYTGSDLAEFRKLQLTLYAHAVEAVLLAGQRARPLGLAYWLVGENGPKVVLPSRGVGWLEEANAWPGVRERLRGWVTTLVRHIRQGAFPLAPRSEHCTLTCPYGQVCRITQARGVGKAQDLPLPGGQEVAGGDLSEPRA
jgi:ATP-dependent helicase/DNAse subunit B